MHFSVVIVCKNEAAIIGKTLAALQGFAPDVVVYDNGSNDATIETVKQYPVNLVQGSWEGFGKTKNTANSYAKFGCRRNTGWLIKAKFGKLDTRK
jgi:glycosyltransferase involved in cell wall biosynthesis